MNNEAYGHKKQGTATAKERKKDSGDGGSAAAEKPALLLI